MNYFSFASTIASIVLSVLAIIMTISSDAKSERVKDSIDSSLEELEEATEIMSKYAAEISRQSQTIQDIFEHTKNVEEVLTKQLPKKDDIPVNHFTESNYRSEEVEAV